MASCHLSTVVFMSELTLMFHNARNCGDVVLTLKKYNGRTKPEPKPRKYKKSKKLAHRESAAEPRENLCLIRAKYKKNKIATIVRPEEAMKFQLQFTQFMRSNMDGLKKEKKMKRKTKKATQ